MKILDGVQVYEARSLMGEKLANKILSIDPNHGKFKTKYYYAFKITNRY